MDNRIILTDETGQETEMEIVLTFEDEEHNRKYVLVKDPSDEADDVFAFSYDEDGNLVSAKDGNGKTAYEYFEDTHILKSYTDLKGVEYSMTYENTTHNLLTTTSDGVTVTNTYDGTVGNVTNTKTTADGTENYLQSTNTYSDNGNHLLFAPFFLKLVPYSRQLHALILFLFPQNHKEP